MTDDDDEISFDDVTVIMQGPPRPPAAPPPAAPPQPPEAEGEPDAPEAWDDRTAMLSPAEHSLQASKPALPFREELAPPAEVAEEDTLAWDDQTRMLSPAAQEKLGGAPALPFQPAPAGEVKPPALVRPALPRPYLGALEQWDTQTEILGPQARANAPSAEALPFASRRSSSVPPSAPASASPALPFSPPPRVELEPPASARPFLEKEKPPAPAPPAAQELPRALFSVIHDPQLAVGTVAWVAPGARAMRTIIAKMTCDVVSSGTATIRGEPDALAEDAHRDGDPQKSLAHASDFANEKAKVDVTLVGHAHADSAVEASIVSFRFGDPGAGGIERRVAVLGERRFERVMGVMTGPGKPLPWRKVPLVYELAFGGQGFPDNPVGIGRDGGAAPQLEDPDRPVRSPRDDLAPACFGPLAPQWGARARASKEAAGAQNQAAPAPQQMASARGDEAFVIAGVHPDFAVLQGRLPGLRPRCFVERKGELGEVALQLDTVAFDMDAMKVNLVFRAALEVADLAASDVEALFVMLESRAGESLSQSDVRERYRQSKAARPRGPAVVEGARVAAEQTRPAEAPPEQDARRREVLAKIARGETLAGLDLAGVDLAGIDLSRQTLVRTNLRGTLLRDARLEGADLTEAVLAEAVLTRARAAGAVFTRADLKGATLDGADLTAASLGEADLSNARCERAIFRSASGADVRFSASTLRGAVFEHADLPGVDLAGAVLDGASFAGAKLPEARLYDVSGAEARFDDAQMPRARLEGARLAGASFARVDAAGSTWDGAALTEARFVSANLAGASMPRVVGERAVFVGANLAGASLRKARLRGASLEAADLTRALLESADLTGADLTGANLQGAETWKAQIDRADLARGAAGPKKPREPGR